jgi:hypothetical protein
MKAKYSNRVRSRREEGKKEEEETKGYKLIGEGHGFSRAKKN